jgi:hypothetical protein
LRSGATGSVARVSFMALASQFETPAADVYPQFITITTTKKKGTFVTKEDGGTIGASDINAWYLGRLTVIMAKISPCLQANGGIISQTRSLGSLSTCLRSTAV